MYEIKDNDDFIFIFVNRLMKICNQPNNVMQFDIKNFILENLFQPVNNYWIIFKIILFISNLAQTPETPCMASVQKSFCQENECEHRLMTINEIINGSVSASLFFCV